MEELRPKDGDPVALPIGVGDMGTATALFSSVMTGLFHRERTGEGLEVSTSLMGNGLWANGCMMQAALVGTPQMPKFTRTAWPNPTTGGVFKTSDNRFIIIVELNPDNIGNLREAFGADHLKGDERFATPQARLENHQALFEEMQGIVGAHELTTVRERLRKFGVNFSVVQTTEECTRSLGISSRFPSASCLHKVYRMELIGAADRRIGAGRQEAPHLPCFASCSLHHSCR